MELHSAKEVNKCKSSCKIYFILITIILTIYIGIGIYFIYYKYLNHDKKTASGCDYVYQAVDY